MNSINDFVHIGKTLNSKDKGWIIGIKSNGIKIFIHQTLLVEIVKIGAKSDLINIKEGPFKDTLCQIQHNLYGQSYIENNFKQKNINISIKDFILTIDGQNYQIIQQTRILKGKYFIGYPILQKNIRIPPYYTRESLGGSKFTQTWFPIVSKEDKIVSYLHFGKISQGCLTVKYQDKNDIWTDIYRKIISSRIKNNYLCKINIY
jgi:hypothetical protein